MQVLQVGLLFGAILVAGGFNDGAEACSCAPPQTGSPRSAVSLAVSGSRAVFIGRALQEEHSRVSPDEATWRTRLRVEEAFAGDPGDVVDVHVGDDSCAVRFTIGETFLVYAHDAGGRYGTSVCSRTGIAAGHPDLSYLRDASNLRPPSGIEPRRGLLLVHGQDSRLAFIDPRSGKMSTLGELPLGPHEIAVSPDGRRAFVTNYDPQPPDGSSLSVVDLATFEITRHFVGSLFRPQAIATSDGLAWYTVESQVQLGSFAADGSQKAEGPRLDGRPPRLVSATRSGMPMTSNADSAEVTFIRRDGVIHVPVPGVPQLLELSPDEHELWVVSGSQVTIVDVARAAVLTTIDLPIRRPGAMQFLPDGGRIVISDLESGDVLVFDAHTYELRGRVHVGRTPADIAIVPNGRQAYIVLTGDNSVVGLDLTRMAVFQTIATGDTPTRIVWAGAR